jgi:hypothetical protein
MPDQEGKIAVHPVCIFKQAWSICWKNLSRLSAVYLIFNLPITIISLLPIFRLTPDQKPNLLVLLWFLCSLVIGSWGYIVLLLGANKALAGQDYTIGQNINQAKTFLVKYLVMILTIVLFVMATVIVAGMLAVAGVAILSQVNKMLVMPVFSILIITFIAGLLFVSLHWSLGGLVCVLEDRGPIAALKRSYALVKQYINPVAGTYGLLALVHLVCFSPMIIAMGAGALPTQDAEARLSSQLGMAIYTVLISIVLVPFVTMLTVVLYKKLKEGFGPDVHA